ncbi:hypothetical protein BpHYR1_003891 [Brachionus plicatilis]|uniref:Uncharacterized protein n=1 Tax=Brachionus plicatilis TaxID=10195 RepID=A0A3M7QPS7_BRAPC|nr:hypothetical protein BpHYR1_003891 [Brachionus plicatilis]
MLIENKTYNYLLAKLLCFIYFFFANFLFVKIFIPIFNADEFYAKKKEIFKYFYINDLENKILQHNHILELLFGGTKLVQEILFENQIMKLLIWESHDDVSTRWVNPVIRTGFKSVQPISKAFVRIKQTWAKIKKINHDLDFFFNDLDFFLGLLNNSGLNSLASR